MSYLSATLARYQSMLLVARHICLPMWQSTHVCHLRQDTYLCHVASQLTLPTVSFCNMSSNNFDSFTPISNHQPSLDQQQLEHILIGAELSQLSSITPSAKSPTPGDISSELFQSAMMKTLNKTKKLINMKHIFYSLFLLQNTIY